MGKLEICCYSVECAEVAQQAGADRVELCVSPAEGGLTPSYGMLLAARQQIMIPVHPIVRPRGGDFCYSQREIALMKSDLACIRELGFAGVVIGVLDEEGQLAQPQLRELLQQCGTMAVTFHRAFDMCADPLLMLQQLTDHGIARILTSGQAATAEQGLPLLQQLIARSRGPVIMPGSGVTARNAAQFIAIGAQELHSSASQLLPSAMRYRQQQVTMSSSGRDEFSRYVVSGQAVADLRAELTAAEAVKRD